MPASPEAPLVPAEPAPLATLLATAPPSLAECGSWLRPPQATNDASSKQAVAARPCVCDRVRVIVEAMTNVPRTFSSRLVAGGHVAESRARKKSLLRIALTFPSCWRDSRLRSAEFTNYTNGEALPARKFLIGMRHFSSRRSKKRRLRLASLYGGCRQSASRDRRDRVNSGALEAAREFCDAWPD